MRNTFLLEQCKHLVTNMFLNFVHMAFCQRPGLAKPVKTPLPNKQWICDKMFPQHAGSKSLMLNMANCTKTNWEYATFTVSKLSSPLIRKPIGPVWARTVEVLDPCNSKCSITNICWKFCSCKILDMGLNKALTEKKNVSIQKNLWIPERHWFKEATLP